MPREKNIVKTNRAITACQRMELLYPDPECQLDNTNAFTLVISVLLSAQTTDAAVNKVTPELFRRWPTPYAMAEADPGEVGKIIRSIGFWKTKAARVVEAAKMIVSDFGGEVPHTMEELTRLPGVGRKTANIVLNDIFDIVEGVAVDTHVFRICTRLKITNKKTPLEAEQDILKLVPQEHWKAMNHQFVLFGREWCDAKKPRCSACPLYDICPSAEKLLMSGKAV